MSEIRRNPSMVGQSSFPSQTNMLIDRDSVKFFKKLTVLRLK